MTANKLQLYQDFADEKKKITEMKKIRMVSGSTVSP